MCAEFICQVCQRKVFAYECQCAEPKSKYRVVACRKGETIDKTFPSQPNMGSKSLFRNATSFDSLLDGPPVITRITVEELHLL